MFVSTRTLVASTLAASILPVSLAHADPGDLDTTFGTDGVFQSPFGTQTSPQVSGAVVLPSGKIVVTASAIPVSGQYRLMLMQLNSNGTLDQDFGTGGFKTHILDPEATEVSDIELTSDGGYMVSGTITPNNNNRMYAAKFTADGELDTNFAINGLLTFNPANRCYLRDTTFQSDGKLVAVGIEYIGNSPRTLITRITPEDLDTTFNDIGKFHDVKAAESVFNGVAMSGNKIVAAGYFYNGSNSDFLIVRHTAEGDLDTSFDTDGIVSVNLGAAEQASSVATLADGRILVAGSRYNGTNNDFCVIRLTEAGAVDTTFGTDGITSLDLAGGWDYPVKIQVQANGKIVMAGYGNNGTDNDFAIVRLEADGSPDESFGTDGIVLVPVGESWDSGTGLAIQSDGKIVVPGSVQVNPVSELGVIRVIGENPVVVVPTRKPDIRIGTSASVPTGNNIYNLTATGQTEEVKISKGRSKTMHLAIQNDGTAADSFKLKGTGNSKNFTVKYKKGESDVTAQVTAGTFWTPSLAPGAVESLTVEIKAKKSAKGKSLKLRLLSSSVAKTSAADAAIIKVKCPKK